MCDAPFTFARRAVPISSDSAGPHFPEGGLPKATRGRLIAPSRGGCLVAVFDQGPYLPHEEEGLLHHGPDSDGVRPVCISRRGCVKQCLKKQPTG